jgi:hypothetical protein
VTAFSVEIVVLMIVTQPVVCVTPHAVRRCGKIWGSGVEPLLLDVSEEEKSELLYDMELLGLLDKSE